MGELPVCAKWYSNLADYVQDQLYLAGMYMDNSASDNYMRDAHIRGALYVYVNFVAFED